MQFIQAFDKRKAIERFVTRAFQKKGTLNVSSWNCMKQCLTNIFLKFHGKVFSFASQDNVADIFASVECKTTSVGIITMIYNLWERELLCVAFISVKLSSWVELLRSTVQQFKWLILLFESMHNPCSLILSEWQTFDELLTWKL